MTESTTQAAGAAVAAARGARRHTGTYKTVEVSAIDLALLLDWCEMAKVQLARGKAISIGAANGFGPAYQRCKDELQHMYQPSRRYDTLLEAVVTEAAYERAEARYGV